MLGQLFNRVAPMKQYAVLAVDKSNLGFARRGGGEAWVVGEITVCCQLAHVHDVRAQRAGPDRQVDVLGRSIRMCEVKSGLLVRHEGRYRNELGGRQTNAECQSCQFDWAPVDRAHRE